MKRIFGKMKKKKRTAKEAEIANNNDSLSDETSKKNKRTRVLLRHRSKSWIVNREVSKLEEGKRKDDSVENLTNNGKTQSGATQRPENPPTPRSAKRMLLRHRSKLWHPEVAQRELVEDAYAGDVDDNQTEDGESEVESALSVSETGTGTDENYSTDFEESMDETIKAKSGIGGNSPSNLEENIEDAKKAAAALLQLSPRNKGNTTLMFSFGRA
eukprot:g3842.t1